MAHDPKELRERAPQVPFPPYPAPPPHTHEWVGRRCACGFRLLRSGMMVMYPSPRNSCGCECHYATDGAERPLAEFRVKYLSRVTAQQSGHALRDLCRGPDRPGSGSSSSASSGQIARPMRRDGEDATSTIRPSSAIPDRSSDRVASRSGMYSTTIV
jgi:hypothetical protein